MLRREGWLWTWRRLASPFSKHRPSRKSSFRHLPLLLLPPPFFLPSLLPVFMLMPLYLCFLCFSPLCSAPLCSTSLSLSFSSLSLPPSPSLCPLSISCLQAAVLLRLPSALLVAEHGPASGHSEG